MNSELTSLLSKITEAIETIDIEISEYPGDVNIGLLVIDLGKFTVTELIQFSNGLDVMKKYRDTVASILSKSGCVGTD